jgi:galacturan 1,4-alpha-galacturonidase
MWTMTLIHAENVLLQDIYVNSTNLVGGPDQNTDGADTIYANNITFLRWSITNGDDSISQKANSTNILVQDSTFYNGEGMAMGSIGQFPGQYETIENVTARNIVAFNTVFAGYAKTWTGIEQGFPPNGGGGGTGFMKNITFTNFTLNSVSQVFSITQCNSYIGATGGCDTSLFQIEDLTWGDMTGTIKSSTVASLQCSGDTPCTGVNISNVAVTFDDEPAVGYLCSNVSSPIGFACNGVTSQT